MNKQAIAFLQDMLRQVLGKLPALTPVGAEGLCAAFPKVSLADSTGFALPDALHQPFPGAGGRAAKAGAKLQAVWDYQSSLFDHCALTPWNIPAQRDVDTVVALAQKGILFLFDVGYVTIHAFARLATAGAYFCWRLNHQTNMSATVAGRGEPVQLAAFLRTVAPDLLLLEKAIFIGEKAQIASRRIAVRMPEAVVNTRRSIARKNAQKKGDTPSQAHLSLLAWNLFITHVPAPIWPTATVPKVYPRRWQIERIFKSWKSALHFATLTTTKADSTLGSLYGRMLRMLVNYALCPQARATLRLQGQRAVSLLKFVRHLQAWAASWLQAIFQSACELYYFLQRACMSAARRAAKAIRKRRTTAQILQDDSRSARESQAFAAVVNA